jgi:serine/threonine-protein kinase
MSDPFPDSGQLELVGQTLGNYRLLHRLGRGGMAEVYLAEQASLERQVAVKVLRRDLAKQDDYVRRFHNEARAVAALVHANIVQIYEVGCDLGVHFIAQEYVPGLNLKQLVTRNGPLEISRAVSILRQVSAALNKAAQRNIVHRDIKPENILLTPTGEVKVADFGLARVMDPRNVDLTQAGLTVGTPLYMSPEQVEGKPLDQRSDLYACGATTFFMLVGRPPFQGDTPLGVAIQHLQSAPPRLNELRPDAPTELCSIVDRLLAKKPEERYRSAAELLHDLRVLPGSQWDQGLHLDDSDMALEGESAAGSLDATRQLQTLMHTQAMTRVRRRRRWAWPIAIVLGGLGGATLAALTWAPLLQISPAEVGTVEQQATAKDQYWHALALNTEEAFLSVEKFHPPEVNPLNQYYVRRARQQLALLYRNRNDLDRALAIYQELAEVEEQESDFKAVGYAGQMIVHYERGETYLARQPLQMVIELRSRLDDQMGEEVDRIVANLQQRLDGGADLPKPSRPL